MKHLFTLLLLGVGLSSALSQALLPGKLAGSLTDSTTTKAVPFATVALMDGPKLLTGTTTDGAGTFVLPNIPVGRYTLLLSFVGYRTKSLPVLLTTEKPSLELGQILMNTEGKTLGEVTVAGQKALVEDKGDRLVYNAEKDISNAGGTAADVLRKVPTLSVDLDGNVQMRGNGNIKVLINGKPSAMMARNLSDALRQMPANVIKSIEVITSPGAKYDAEGSAGVINIITKKALQGFNGTATVTAGTMNRGVGTSLNLKKKKFGLSLSANGYQFRNQRENQSTRTALMPSSDGPSQPLSILTQQSSADNTGTGGYGEMSIDYDPDSTNHFNFAANVWGGYYPNNSNVVNRLTNPAGEELQAFRNDIRFSNPYGNGQLDLGYTKTFQKPGQEFSILTQFSRMPDNYVYDTDRYSMAEQLIYRQHSSNYSSNQEYTFQTDYTHPFTINGRKDTTSLKLEVGLKGILRDIGSEYRVSQSLDGQGALVTDSTQSNDFNYIQRVYSAYTALRIDTKRKWNLNAGARIEHTDIQGDFTTTQTKLASQYSNLIPSFTLAKTIKTHTVKVSYTQRIQRPMVWYLNPWLNQSDPKNIQTGNPYLNPELSHATELAYSVSTKNGLSVNTALYWRLTNNAIDYVSTVDAAGVSINKPQNIAQRKAYGLNLNLSSQPIKNWNLNGGGDVRYVDLFSPALNQGNNGLVWNVNLNTSYKLPNNFTLQANGNFNSSWVSLQGTNTGFYWHSISAKREFVNKQASLTLGLNNPFNRGVVQTSHQSAPTFESEARNYYIRRSIRLSFEWRFGQMSAGGGKKGKKISNDDKDGR
ncbi:TonB-dependent receptor domain-containing protein [Spirosoma endophyticum]|uniref:Outer membrane receptor proteins, mostly Fe transport n=1 Tax=Spirosoma endophyticum TaxID=662367 RepID=A0A1I1N7I3_9BACT|nr:TonB-dependent receptor [Spirosoma endophyticum]SFC90743.1 Outer membrane receptor proteins, mostly Fe transport [Spirosoma endophyticum]